MGGVEEASDGTAPGSVTPLLEMPELWDDVAELL